MNTKQFLTIGGLLGGWLFVLSLLIFHLFTESQAATITIMAGSDTLSASRSVINTNFGAINQELTYNDEAVIWTLNSATAFRIYNSQGSSTVFTVDTASGSTTVANTFYASNLYATSTTATSSFLGPVRLADNDLSINGVHYKFPIADGSSGQILSTNGAGTLTFATDAGSSPDITYGLISATRYYQASTTATDNLAWRFGNGFVSQASSTITGLTNLASLTVGATSELLIPTAANPTVATAGEIALHTTSGSTSLRYYDSTASAEYSLTPYRYLSASYATSTAWVGTTTVGLGLRFYPGTAINAWCVTNAGTLYASFATTTSLLSRMTIIPVTTTKTLTGISANTAISYGDEVLVDFGTPASSPTRVNCTLRILPVAD